MEGRTSRDCEIGETNPIWGGTGEAGAGLEASTGSKPAAGFPASSSSAQRSRWARRNFFNARREAALPASVRGPVERCALRRLALSCATDVISAFRVAESDSFPARTRFFSVPRREKFGLAGPN